MSSYGIRRCHYRPSGGRPSQLAPDPASAEGWRARFGARHPGLSRALAAGSVLLLVIGVGLNLLQLAEPVSQIPPVMQRVGTFESPIHLPIWLNIALGVGPFWPAWSAHSACATPPCSTRPVADPSKPGRRDHTRALESASCANDKPVARNDLRRRRGKNNDSIEATGRRSVRSSARRSPHDPDGVFIRRLGAAQHVHSQRTVSGSAHLERVREEPGMHHDRGAAGIHRARRRRRSRSRSCGTGPLIPAIASAAWSSTRAGPGSPPRKHCAICPRQLALLAHSRPPCWPHSTSSRWTRAASADRRPFTA